MSETKEHEARLSEEEVAKILSICSPQGLLVGGQALAFWADHLGVGLPPDLESGVTADVDFIGGSLLARHLADELGWDVWIPTLDDATPNTGKVTHKLADGGVKQVDFLSGVIGLTTQDIVRRAAELDVDGLGRIRVIHPVDVLDSRIQNLELLREKRNAMGIAQARLAIEVVKEYMKSVIDSEGDRAGLKLLERVAGMAQETRALRVNLRHGIDPLIAVPIDSFRMTPALQSRRWPQIVQEVEQKRVALRMQQTHPTKA